MYFQIKIGMYTQKQIIKNDYYFVENLILNFIKDIT